MSASWRRRCWLLEIALAQRGVLSLQNALGMIVLGISGAMAFSGSPVLAQITPDATLGTESSVVTPKVDVRGLPADRIDGGAARGANLFHSFSQFNVGEGLRVYFANPAGIENILTRVTGNNLSNILGTLGVDGGASLFLLNPNGIIFGPSAKLDIAGSFVASTANSVVFENGFVFSATKPEAPPLLTIKVPLGLQNGSNPSGTITNAGNLAVGQNLGLAADNLDLQGQLQAGGNLALFASNTVRVRDTATNPFIASAGSQLVVQGNQGVDIFALNHPQSGFLSGGDMVLRSANSVVGDARYSSGGSFRVEGLEGNLGDLSSIQDPIIRSAGDVSFTNYFGTSLHIVAGGSVTIPGIVVITAPETGTAGIDYIAEDVTLSDGTIVSIDGRTRPTFDVRAGVNPAEIGLPGVTGVNTDLFFSGFFNFFGFLIPISENPAIPNTATSADIKIGGIAMLGSNAANGMVLLTNQYKPNTTLPGGDIEVGAIVTTDNVSQVANQLPADFRNLLDSFGLLEDFTGNGGDVVLDSRSKIALNGTGLANFGLNFGLIITSSGTGNAGDITLLAADAISLANSFILSDTSGTERGGDITFKGRSVSLTNGTAVSASTSGTGQGGNLTISTERLTVRGGSQVAASTSSQGRGGNLTVNASRLVELIGTSGDARAPSGLFTETGGDEQGGNITISTPQLSVQDGAIVSVGSGRTSDLLEGKVSDNRGNGGNLTVTADLIELSGTSANPILRSAFQAGTASLGNAGDIRIDTNRLIVRNGAVILAATLHEGDSSSITVNADSVEVAGTAPDTLPSGISTGTVGTGRGRDLTINTRTLTVRNGGLISAATYGPRAGGNLTVNASELVELVGTTPDGRPGGLSAGSGLSGVSSIPLLQLFGVDPSKATGDSGNLNVATGRLIVRDGAEVSTATIGPGIGGNIQVRANSLDLSNGARLSAATSGSGRAGNISVQEADSIALSNSSISTAVNAGAVVNDTAAERGGNINLQTRQLSLTNGSEVAASTSGQGNAGSIGVQEADSVSLSNSSISTAVNTGALGQGGKIDIQTGSLSLDNGAQVSAATSGQGNAGSIALREANSVSLSNSSISSAVNGGAVGEGGDIDIQARSLSLNNSAQVSAATSGTGKAGSISLREADSVALSNSSISSAVNGGAVGEGGDIDIQARSLSLNNSAQVSAATSGTGKAGSISVREADSVSLSNSSISTAVNPGAVGQGGDIDIQARSLSVDNRAQISASTSGQGKAGSIEVTANTVEATNGGQLLTSTASSEDAGNITLAVRDDIKLAGAGSGVFANTAPGSTGNGGSIFLNPRTLLVRDGAGIGVDSQGAGEGGNVQIQADSITLDRQAFISAKTASNTGGDITLGVRDLLLLRRGSEISTTAGTAQAGGDGGNIRINADFILGIPQENSDITANAFKGRGGNINITTQGIFGLEFRPRLTPLSDITASSEFGINGTVQINTLGIDPNRGLAELPADIVDASGLIDRRCAPGEGTAQNSSFTVTGRGGLPPNPNETLGEEGMLEDLGTPTAVRDGTQGGRFAAPVASSSSPPKQVVEAQGWVIGPNGTVILTAQATSATPQHPWQTPASCQSGIQSIENSKFTPGVR